MCRFRGCFHRFLALLLRKPVVTLPSLCPDPLPPWGTSAPLPDPPPTPPPACRAAGGSPPRRPPISSSCCRRRRGRTGEIERRITLLIKVLKLVSDFEEGLVKIVCTLLQWDPEALGWWCSLQSDLSTYDLALLNLQGNVCLVQFLLVAL